MPDSYQRLLLDAMNGDASLFARSDEVEVAWSIIDPILAAWQSPAAPPLETYPARRLGPRLQRRLDAGPRPRVVRRLPGAALGVNGGRTSAGPGSIGCSMNENAIVTLAIGEPYLSNWQKYCAAHWHEYAEKHNFDLIVLTEPLDHSPVALARSPSWQKCLIWGQDFAPIPPTRRARLRYRHQPAHGT